jgi:hypothetical protein
MAAAKNGDGQAGSRAGSRYSGGIAAGVQSIAAMRAGRVVRPELLLVLLLAAPLNAKEPPPSGQSEAKMPTHPSLTQQSAADEQAAADARGETRSRYMRGFYLAQQKAMVKDTDRLLELAKQLDAEVGSEHAGMLTPEERREAAEIEKLARSVKEKMSAPVPAGMGDQQARRIFTR